MPKTKKAILDKHQNVRLKAIDFFCGAGGMSYGLSRSGINVLGGIDIDTQCKETYEFNNKPAKFFHKNVCTLSTEELAQEFNIEPYENNLIFVACSPCQFWSKINTDRRKNKNSAYLLNEFKRFIDYFRPAYIIIENVPGIQNKSDKTILPEFIAFLLRCQYVYDARVLNAIRFHVPQNRYRFILIASRLHDEIKLPKGRTNKNLTVRNFIGQGQGFPQIEAGHPGTPVIMHTASNLSSKNLQRIKLTSHNGGDRFAWKDNENLQIPAYGGKDNSFKDVYARMWWDRPAPTITTRFNSLSNGRFGHPEQDRAISLREGATLQTFPKRYRFIGSSQATIARLIGNAVPPAFAERIGRYLIRTNINGKI